MQSGSQIFVCLFKGPQARVCTNVGGTVVWVYGLNIKREAMNPITREQPRTRFKGRDKPQPEAIYNWMKTCCKYTNETDIL